MTRPAAGLQTIFHGRPIELLYLKGVNREGQIWRVRPLFVEGEPDRDELIGTHAALRPIHTNITGGG